MVVTPRAMLVRLFMLMAMLMTMATSRMMLMLMCCVVVLHVVIKLMELVKHFVRGVLILDDLWKLKANLIRTLRDTHLAFVIDVKQFLGHSKRMSIIMISSSKRRLEEAAKGEREIQRKTYCDSFSPNTSFCSQSCR